MISVQRQTRIVSLSLIATTTICLLIGLLIRVVSSHKISNADGYDWSLIMPYVGLLVGLLGSGLGLIVGAITTYLTRKSERRNIALYGYLLPAILPIPYMVTLLVLNP